MVLRTPLYLFPDRLPISAEANPKVPRIDGDGTQQVSNTLRYSIPVVDDLREAFYGFAFQVHSHGCTTKQVALPGAVRERGHYVAFAQVAHRSAIEPASPTATEYQ